MEKLPALNNEALKAYSLQSELIEQTARQIIKDFNGYGIDLSFNDISINAYDELHSNIEPVVKKLLGTNAALLLELLYRIDIKESALSQNVDLPDETASDKITRLIIYRELQKVVTRNYFSKL
jgi:hypothetical protein